MNDKLRLAPIAGGSDYTHIVRTTNWSDGGKDTTHSGYNGLDGSSITPQGIPSIIEPIKITSLFTQLSTKTTSISTDLPIPPYDFYLGRKDIGVVHFNGFPQHSLAFSLFSENDWGKDIYIWLATTPPPLVLVKELGQRNATFLRRWRDAKKGTNLSIRKRLQRSAFYSYA